MARLILLLAFVTLLIHTLAAPTRYTMRYGAHDIKPAKRVVRKVAPGAAEASELARLVRRRARHVNTLRERRVRAAREAAERAINPPDNDPISLLFVFTASQGGIMALAMRENVTKSASITATQSTTLVKNLFRAAFSSVAYIRNFFDDDCFQLGKIGTTRYHKIVSVERDDVKCFVDWLEKGIFDALQKKYLQMVLLEVFEELAVKKNKKKVGVRRKLLECYTFSVTYVDGQAQLALAGDDNNSTNISKERIKQTTGEVLRSLVQLTSSLDPLPASRIISMKLLYTEETPEAYEPPLFRKASDEEASWFNETPLRMEAGVVTTPYHQLSMTIQAGKKTGNKENGNRAVKNQGRNVDKEKSCIQIKKEKVDRALNEERDRNEGAADVNIESSEPRLSQAKGLLGGSDEMVIDGGIGSGDNNHTFDLQTREDDAKLKKTSGRKRREASQAVDDGPSRKKRKMSVVDRDISKKRKGRGKATCSHV